MRLQHIDILPALKGYIEKMWVFESSGPIPDVDMKLIVPNGLIKLVVPFRNGLSGKMEGWQHLSQENSITLIGICDLPSIVDAETPAASGTIGVEFSPLGAYRFFHLRQSEIKNRIHPLIDVLGKIAIDIEQQIANAESTEMKVILLQQFLLKLFLKKDNDPIFDYCVQKINSTNGGIAIKQLEKETGYSSRWLNMKFDEKVGISPKNLSSIVRFQHYYKALATDSIKLLMQKEFYSHYYDQSHFIKEFKRFTGLAPTKFENTSNDFGKIFYRD